MPGIPAVIDLTNLASYGFVIIGSQSGETAGWRVASAGDINGDGFDDMLVDSRSHSSNTGEVHLVFGKASGFGDVDLASLSASDGFTISAAGASDFLGLGIASAGDINNDGYDDFVVTAPSADNVPFEGNGGKAYVVFGKAGGFSSFNVGSLALPDGFFIRGDLVNDQLGWSVSSAGDFNHDGYDDIIVSTQGGSAKAYLIFGKASGFANIDLSALAPADGFLIQGGASSVETGWSVSSGDVNGDDFDDLIIGTSYGDDGGTDAGQAYVIFGKSSGFATIDLATLAPSAGFIIQGDAAFNRAGFSVSAGDINGDGNDDIIVGASTWFNAGGGAGKTYVIFGKSSGLANIDLSALAPGDGFVIQGNAGDLASYSVASAGDVNGDGFDDLIVGAFKSDAGGSDSGAAYVVFGKADGFTDINLNLLKPTEGIIIIGGDGGDWAGFSVAAAGDVNNDGFDDLMIGAPLDDTDSRANPGKAYVIFGASTAVVLDELDGDISTYTDGGGAVLLDDNTPVVALASLITDQTNLNGATLTISITANEVAAEDVLGISTAGTVTLSGGTSVGSIVSVGGVAIGTIGSDGNGGDDLVINLDTGDANPARITSLIRALSYSNSNIEPSTATRTITIALDAGGLGSDSATVQVNLVAANNEPTVTATALDPTFTEGSAATDLFSTVNVGGLETGQSVTSIILSVTNVTDTLHEYITVDGTEFLMSNGFTTSTTNGVGVSVAFSGSTALLTLTPLAGFSAGDLAVLVDGLAYRNDSIAPTDANRVVTVAQVNDNGANTAPDDAIGNPNLSSTVNVNPVDSAATAGDDANNVTETGTIIGATVFTNDDDSDGPALQVGKVNGSAGDVDVEIELDSGALVTMRADGSYDYDPNGAFDWLISPTKAAATGAVNVSATDSFTYTLVGGNTATVTVTINGEDGPGDELHGNSGNNAITGTSGDDVFVLGQGGNDSASGLAGNDVFRVGATFDGLDSINGGADFDRVFLNGDYATSPLVLSATNLVGVDAIAVTHGHDYDITFNDANIAAGATMIIESVDLLGDTLVVDGSQESDGNFLFIGGEHSDDEFHGGAGNDFIIGGGGDNILAGNGGIDTVAYDSAYSSTLGAVDVDLALGIADNGFGGTDQLSLDIENVIGSDFGDEIDGNSLDNRLDGGGGADLMRAGNGNDTYVVDHVSDVASEFNEFGSPTGGTDTVESSVTYTISNLIENLVLTGIADINGTGNSAANVLTGNSGNNILDGGALGDTMAGGNGDDTYVVDSVGDVVTEAAASGEDTVRSSLSHTLATNVENLVLTGSSAINGTGNSLVNRITGNIAANVLDGGAGADRLVGGQGDDTYHFDNVGDRAVEKAGNGIDTVLSSVGLSMDAGVDNVTLTGAAAINATGNGLNNLMIGNSAANELNGFTGADEMRGGAGNDTYSVDNVGDVVVENAGEGIDTIISRNSLTLGANVENLTLIGTASMGTGNSLANLLLGNALGNTLNGGAGADEMRGGAGNDSYVVDNVADTVVEGSGNGTDTVSSSVSFGLGANVENLTLTGSAGINATGNGQANLLLGNTGNNTLNGGTGADEMRGGAGNDTYFVDNVGDVVVEAAGNGTDAVNSSASFTLGTGLENLTLTGASAIGGTGNNAANTISGNGAANILAGGLGNDTLQGGGGNDVLNGGSGLDSLQGDSGADQFLFDSALNAASNLDHILDFTHGSDKIVLENSVFATLATGALSANAFVLGAAAADADDRILYDAATGNLYFDADGTGATAKILFATLDTHPILTASDFQVI